MKNEREGERLCSERGTVGSLASIFAADFPTLAMGKVPRLQDCHNSHYSLLSTENRIPLTCLWPSSKIDAAALELLLMLVHSPTNSLQRVPHSSLLSFYCSAVMRDYCFLLSIYGLGAS